MENNEKKSALVPILLLIIIILVVLCVLFATDVISFKTNANVVNEPEIFDEKEEKNEKDTFNSTIIELKKENESFDFEKLHLDFKGVSTEDGDDFYKYLLDIKIDNNDIDSSFFNDNSNYKIWSNNMAANFKIYRFDNVYVLVSFIAKQCFCDEVMIINTNGEVLETFTNATFEFDKDTNLLNISTSEDGECMGDDYEEHVSEYIYSVKDDTIVLN